MVIYRIGSLESEQEKNVFLAWVIYRIGSLETYSNT